MSQEMRPSYHASLGDLEGPELLRASEVNERRNYRASAPLNRLGIHLHRLQIERGQQFFNAEHANAYIDFFNDNFGDPSQVSEAAVILNDEPGIVEDYILPAEEKLREALEHHTLGDGNVPLEELLRIIPITPKTFKHMINDGRFEDTFSEEYGGPAVPIDEIREKCTWLWPKELEHLRPPEIDG